MYIYHCKDFAWAEFLISEKYDPSQLLRKGYGLQYQSLSVSIIFLNEIIGRKVKPVLSIAVI